MDMPFCDFYDIHCLNVYCIGKILSYCQTAWTVKLFANSSSSVNLGVPYKQENTKVIDGCLTSANRIVNCVRLKSEICIIPQPLKLSLGLTIADTNSMAVANTSEVCSVVKLLDRNALPSCYVTPASLFIQHFYRRETFFGGLIRCVLTESPPMFVHSRQCSMSDHHCKAYPYVMFMMACYDCAKQGQRDQCCFSPQSNLKSIELDDCLQDVSTEISRQISEDTGMFLQSDSTEETPSDDEVCSLSRFDTGLSEERAIMAPKMKSCCICSDINGIIEDLEVADYSTAHSSINASDNCDAGYVKMSADADAECPQDMVYQLHQVCDAESFMVVDTNFNNGHSTSELVCVETPCNDVHKSCEESGDDTDWSDDDDHDSDDDTSFDTDDSRGTELMTCGSDKLNGVNLVYKTHCRTPPKKSSVCSAFFVRGSVSSSDESSSSEDEKHDALQDDCDSDNDDHEENWSSDQDQEDFSCLADLDPFQVSGLYVPPASTSLVTRPNSCSMSKKFDESHETDDNSPIKLINNKWNLVYGSSKHLPVSKIRKVSFDEASPALIPVLNEDEWAEDYRDARISFWEELARDRDRFKRRIMETAGKIEWVLKPQHRDKRSDVERQNRKTIETKDIHFVPQGLQHWCGALKKNLSRI